MKKESKSESPELIGERSVGQAAKEYAESFKKGTFLEHCLRIEAFKKGAKWGKKAKDELKDIDVTQFKDHLNDFIESQQDLPQDIKKALRNRWELVTREPFKEISIKELESFAIEFADYMRCECWEYDHMGQKTHSTSEHLAHFKEKYFPK